MSYVNIYLLNAAINDRLNLLVKNKYNVLKTHFTFNFIVFLGIMETLPKNLIKLTHL